MDVEDHVQMDVLYLAQTDAEITVRMVAILIVPDHVEQVVLLDVKEDVMLHVLLNVHQHVLDLVVDSVMDLLHFLHRE